jgi:hypothetical protein
MGHLLRAFSGLAAVGVVSGISVAHAGSSVPDVVSTGTPPAEEKQDVPAHRYARLDRSSCEGELRRRGVFFESVDEARGVLAPIRLTGPLHGVTYRTELPTGKRASSPWEIVDCRLALALDDFASQLAAHDIVEVIHFSVYRPPSRRWPVDRIASRHPGALAIDASTFIKRDRQMLAVERDFHGRIGSKTCGPSASPRPATPEALELRKILCDAT